MSTTNIEINCVDQALTLGNNPVIASGGVNEEKIKFTFDDKWDGFTKKALFYRSADAIYRVDIDTNNECIVPAIVLTEPGILYISVYGTSGEERRTSNVIAYRIVQGSNADAPDPLERYKAQWSEEVKVDLADALEYSATQSELEPMPEYDEMTLDELVDEVHDNLIYTEEKQEKVADCELLNGCFEKINRVPEIMLRTNGIAINYSLPFLNTKSMNDARNNLFLSPYIQKIGFDLTSANPEFICTVQNSNKQFFNYASALQEIKLTNCGTQICWGDYGNTGAFSDKEKLSKVEIYGFNKNHNVENCVNMFRDCTSLQSINFVNGVCTEELDFTGIQGVRTWNKLKTFRMFDNCVSLKHIRFKPFTIQESLSFAQSLLLTRESVLSIINGLDELTSGKTISFNTYHKNRFDGWSLFYDTETGIFTDGEGDDGQEHGEVTYHQAITDYKGWILG